MKPLNKKISIILSVMALLAYLFLPSLDIGTVSRTGMYIIKNIFPLTQNFFETFILTGLILFPLLAIWFSTDGKRYKWLSGVLLFIPCILAYIHFETGLGMMVYILCALGTLAIPILRHSNGRNFQRVRAIYEIRNTKDTTFMRLFVAVVVIIILDICLVRCTDSKSIISGKDSTIDQIDSVITAKEAKEAKLAKQKESSRRAEARKKAEEKKQEKAEQKKKAEEDHTIYQYVHIIGNDVCLRIASDNAQLLRDNNGKNIHVNTGQLMKHFGEENGYYKVMHDTDTCYVLKQFAQPVGF